MAPGSPRTAPELVRAMCEANAEQVLPVLDRAIELLARARTSLAEQRSVADLVGDGHAARMRYDGFSRREIAGIIVGDQHWRQRARGGGPSRRRDQIRSASPG